MTICKPYATGATLKKAIAIKKHIEIYQYLLLTAIVYARLNRVRINFYRNG